MVVQLFHFDPSPPSRAAKMTAKALNLNVDIHVVNLTDKEQYKEEYLKLNPTHTVPTLNDDGFVVWDSHAIAQYLCDRYGHEDSLYPKNFEDRTLVNQMLFFETSVVFPSLANAVRPIFYGHENCVTQARIDEIENCFQYLECFLSCRKYLASDNNFTIADICTVATVTTIEIFHQIDTAKYCKLTEWLEEMKKMDFYTENVNGIEQFRKIFSELLDSSQKDMPR